MKKYENGPFSMPILDQIRLHMANKNIYNDNQHGKMKEMYISDFDFGNFSQRSFAKHNERFSKIIKL